MKIFSKEELKTIFQAKYNRDVWKLFLINYWGVTSLRSVPEELEGNSELEKGYFLGQLNTKDKEQNDYIIGIFHFNIKASSVVHKKIGLRKLVKPFLKYSFDAALVTFDDGTNWRFSFICDIKGSATSPKRFTFVFGDEKQQYRTAIDRFYILQQSGISYENIQIAFSVEALSKDFYGRLFKWYQWALSSSAGVTFPNYNITSNEDRDDMNVKVIRLITRLLFVWFIKQIKLVPDSLFDQEYISTILKDFNPVSKEDGSYYNAILQNLFFATLNRPVIENGGEGRRFATAEDARDLRNLYRYSEMFSISEDNVIRIFSKIPFLNGGLFECLDKFRSTDICINNDLLLDGFSRNGRKDSNGNYLYRAHVPNILFFNNNEDQIGIIELLKEYNFTIEENSTNDAQISLDPELLGRAFENLLASYNPETQESARNSTGSFYTPREIVDYMVNESLFAHLSNAFPDFSIDDIYQLVFKHEKPQKWNSSNCQNVANDLQGLKILDPACGSGAFPMGYLLSIVDIIDLLGDGQANRYLLKLGIINNCIYGVDIQPIAMLICKLRFFISLICEQREIFFDSPEINYGINILPNLETKFVAADTLIDLPDREMQGNLFENPAIAETKYALKEIRKQHFSAKSPEEKRKLRKQDEALRNKLIMLLKENHDFSPRDAELVSKWNPYDQNSHSPFFNPEWMFGVNNGFDIVIGNPPYIQLQSNHGLLATNYEKCNYSTFARTGDIYCLFYERGWQLLKDKGLLCFITSNKWMRAAYGEKTRAFLSQQTNPISLIDFAGVRIFESATVDTNIILFEKSNNRHSTSACSAKDPSCRNNLSDYVRQNSSYMDFADVGCESWAILSPIEQRIKHKIESVGVPLKDWDIQINYGIKTGYNEAFIITTEKRNQILANCLNDDEHRRTDELIRPILRGRDIKKYGYEWANLWLINTHNGVKGKFPRIDINDYPAVKAHLDEYWDKIKDRADQGDTPYNLRNCAYLEDFYKPKIVYPNMTKYLPFTLDETGLLTNQKCFIITGNHISFLTAFLNSSLFKYCFRDVFPELQGGTRELSKIFFDKIPIIKVDNKLDNIFHAAIMDIQNDYSNNKARNINKMIFDLYDLSDKESEFIESIESD